MSDSPVPANADLVARLRSAVGDSAVRTERSEVHLFDHDASNLVGRAGIVCYPRTPDQVQAIVRCCHEFGVPFVARGSGTGLAGGATPVDGSVVVCLSKMDRIISIDVDARTAWVEPGVLNLDLTRAASEHGLHFAPDPSSQQSCSIGGNVANNSGGPHCLAEGVTSAHVLACDVVLSDGTTVRLGDERFESAGFDLRGAFVGSEGMFGIATAVCVRLTPNPPAVSTMLLDFSTVRDGTDTVSAIIAAGLVPAALEMMDRLCLEAVEAFVHAGLPTDAATALLVELAGSPAAVQEDSETVHRIGLAHGARSVRIAADDEERALLWKGRKNAFGAIARIAPNYYLHDTVVPRRHLSEVLDHVYRIAAEHELRVLNVFHAGDGNLHPLLIFDRREPGVLERVHAAGAEIVRISVEYGGVLSGEHGIGLEKRDYMPLMFGEVDLAAQSGLRRAFDPHGLANPHKVLPSPAGCGDAHGHVEGLWV